MGLILTSAHVGRITGQDQRRLTNLETAIDEVRSDSNTVNVMHDVVDALWFGFSC